MTAILQGKTLKVVSLQNAPKEAMIPVRSGSDPNLCEVGDTVETYIIPVGHVTAMALIQNLQALLPEYANLTANADGNALIITDTTANIRRLMQIVKALDTHMATVAEIRVFHLKNADATSTATLINTIFQQQAQGGRGGFGGRGGLRRWQPLPDDDADAGRWWARRNGRTWWDGRSRRSRRFAGRRESTGRRQHQRAGRGGRRHPDQFRRGSRAERVARSRGGRDRGPGPRLQGRDRPGLPAPVRRCYEHGGCHQSALQPAVFLVLPVPVRPRRRWRVSGGPQPHDLPGTVRRARRTGWTGRDAR